VDEYVGSYSLAGSALIAHLFRCTLLAGTPALPDTGEIADLARWPVDGLPTPKTNLLHHGMPDALARRTAVERSGLPRIT
jgi:hypothetical protein